MAKTYLHHIALQYADKEKAKIFFKDILNLQLKKTFSITPELTNSIFGINEIEEDIEILVYEDGETRFEIFITDAESKSIFEHVCICVDSKEKFIEQCEKHGLKPWKVQKNGKNLLFVKDFSNNLFEVKEK